MTEWYFLEQQSTYRRQEYLDEAARSRRSAQAPRLGIREQLAGALITVATRLAPAATASRLGVART